ncbi:MAG TPA: serine hydrolase domain-containing protein [Longimicrobium sp.]|nr:serine hydrolase domain-containing protein [Longimicrobium sp.]
MHATRLRASFPTLLVLAALAGCAAPAPRATATPAAAPGLADAMRPVVQRVVDSLQAGAKYPGVTVGVAFRDGSSLGAAAGLADTARREPMTPAHLMLQGSVGKTYVAAVALQLVGEGRLELDAPVSRYLGDLPWFGRLPNAAGMTVRMLMNHTSGLQRYEFSDAFTRDLTAQPQRVWRPEELLAYLHGAAPPFAPGAGWDYSDTNYIVLGMIIERITGSRYYDEARRRLLVPLGLDATTPSDRALIPGLAQGYAGPGNPFGGADAMLGAGGRMSINPQFEWTGGGMASTARDLARWAHALYGGRVLAPELMREMLAGVPAPLGPQGTTYGLGVIVRPLPLGTAHGHSGFFPGWVTEVMYFPDRQLAVAVQVNTSHGPALDPPPTRVLGAVVRALDAAGAAPPP